MEEKTIKLPDWVDSSVEALCGACCNGSMEKIQKALKNLKHKEDINKISRGGYTALQLARAKGNKKLVEFLLNQGADPNLPDVFGFTALQLACWRGQNEIATLLLKNGANPKKTDPFGFTTLDLANQIGNTEIIPLLEEKERQLAS